MYAIRERRGERLPYAFDERESKTDDELFEIENEHEQAFFDICHKVFRISQKMSFVLGGRDKEKLLMCECTREFILEDRGQNP